MASQGNRAAQAQNLLEHYSRLKKALIWGLVAAVIMLVVGIMVLLSKPEPQGPSAVPATAPAPKRMKWIRLETFEVPADKYSEWRDVPLSPTGAIRIESGDADVDIICENGARVFVHADEENDNRGRPGPRFEGKCRFMGIGKPAKIRLSYPVTSE
jgi:hypothetical protein